MEVIRMKRKFVCTKEKTLSEQLNGKSWMPISEIILFGFLEGKDLMLLSEMSKAGNLRILDMSGVTEINTAGLDGTIDYTPFYYNNQLEEVYLPNIDKLIYPMFYNCTNLKKVEFPSSIKHLDAFLAKCPNVEEIYVPEDLHIDCDRRFDSDICFMGSGKRFVSDNEGWPEDLKDIQSNFFAFDRVLYTVPYGGCVSLYRYPAGDERKDFDIPEGVYQFSEYAFYDNPYLRKVTIPESVKSSEEHPFQNCENLETIIFKNKSFRMFSGKDSDYIGWPVGMKGLPRLQDIYLYAEDPDVFCFDLFDGLENINDVTLHVPCCCKKLYQNYEVIYYSHGSLCERKEYSFRKFKSIEEFDPIDFLDE
jgi:hypothetical protein